jgi:hypothetical protein
MSTFERLFSSLLSVLRQLTAPTDMAGDPWCISATGGPPLLSANTLRRLRAPERDPSEAGLTVQPDLKVAA